jgi:hypothetical protein
MTEAALQTLEDQLKAMISAGQIRYNQMLNVMDSVPGNTPLSELTAEQVALINIKLSASDQEDCEFCSG